MKTPPADLERLIQDALAELGSSADASALAEKVRRLDVGLPCEDEFSVVCSWLGQCRLLHKLNQQQVPISSRNEFQVPDLLAFFSTQCTKSPVLIEVKSNKANKLSFTPDYFKRLVNYAELLNLPLLIAWKFCGIWILFEAKHLKKTVKNFNISLSTAMQENLLGVLAGDVAYKIGAGVGLHLRFRKDKMVGQEKNNDGLIEQWMTTIDEVVFTDYQGTRRTDLDNEVQSLFTAWDLEDREEHTESHVQLSYMARSDGIQFAHMALVPLLSWESPQDQRPHWRRHLRKEQVTANVTNFSDALDAAFRQHIVSHIFYVQPRSMPEFLSSP